jgi:SAM-dependent methyltransferase
VAGNEKAASLGEGEFLQAVYATRFTGAELASKTELWQVLVEDFLQALVPENATVLDLGAGNCEFINAVRAGRKIAVDLNPDLGRYADPDVQTMITTSDNLSEVSDSSVDVVFTSNFFEHLPSKDTLLATLTQCRRVLKVGGRLIVLMPNIRYLPGAYWDYLDHHLPLTHLSVCEALELTGLTPVRVESRFLPYTVRNSRIRARRWMLRLYLRFKPAWLLLGKQMLVVAVKG